MPTFFPGTLQEVLDFGLHAVACSRASGLWSAMKVVTNIADSAGTVQVWPARVGAVIPEVEDPRTPRPALPPRAQRQPARAGVDGPGAVAVRRPAGDRAPVRGAQPAQPGDGPDARRLARRRRRGQGLLRARPGARRPRPRPARAGARGRAAAEGRHALPARPRRRFARSARGSRKCWWSRRSCRSWRPRCAMRCTARPTRRGSSASATSTTRRCWRPRATSTPTRSPWRSRRAWAAGCGWSPSTRGSR